MSEQSKCTQLESNTFTAGDYSLSISTATRAMVIAMERNGIELSAVAK